MQREGGFPKEYPGGRPPPSTSSPCPAWFFPLRSPFFRRSKTAVQKRFAPLQLLPLIEFAQERPPPIVSQTPCFSQSLNHRQQVDGDGNSSGKSCHRAPLRRIHKMPSSTLRSGAGGRPPRGRGGRWGSQGRIFSHWASVSNRPYRAIRPSSGANSFFYPLPHENNYSKFNPLSRVLKCLLVLFKELQIAA
jgi:hypothetical protein